MWRFCDVFFIVIIIKNIVCFNIDTTFPIVYVDPAINTTRSNYFGYSTVLYPGNNMKTPWILIGSPRGQSHKNSFENSGVCYKCGIQQICSPFEIEESQKGFIYKEKLDGAWIGGSMDINYNFDRVVVCGFRSIKNSGPYLMYGVCYWFHIADNSTERKSPFENEVKDVYTDPNNKISVYYYGQGQAGFSVHMPPKEKELLLGAPGVYNWDGTSLIYRDTVYTPIIANRFTDRRPRSAQSNEFQAKVIGNSRFTTQTVPYDLFGYSSSSGYFYSSKRLYYVSGAPRSRKYRGQVLVYDFMTFDAGLVVKEVRYGDQFGDYFGASLTSGDINGDGLDDLIVGAPMFAAEKYNEGKIHIFMGDETQKLRQLPKRESLVGKVPNGQFGFTVQYLNDIDHDGYGDIAVSAPYEENTGVVYIFRGSSEGLQTVECQRIVGNDISTGLRGFGMSISRPADVDYNKYLDIAVGAPLSGHAVLLRTRPTVTIYHSLRSFSESLNIEQEFFLVEACFWYRFDQNYYRIAINRTLGIDVSLQRAILQDANYNDIINLKPNEKVCENYTITLKHTISDQFEPIVVSLSHYYEEHHSEKEVVYIEKNGVVGTEKLCVRCPMYNKYNSDPTAILRVPFSLGCKKNNACEASLELRSRIKNLREENVLVLGTTDYLTLETTIRNLGEKAYLTKLEVQLPEMITFQIIPSHCEQNASLVVCAIDNPLDTNDEKILNLDLDVSSLNKEKYDEELLTIVVTVVTISNNNLNNQTILDIKLVREADVTITGKSEEQSYSYRNASQTQLQFDKTYQIEKFGPSSLSDIMVELDIPYKFRTSNGEDVGFVSLYAPNDKMKDEAITCKSDFKYLSEENIDSGNDVNSPKRRRRSEDQVEVFKESALAESQKLMKRDGFDDFQNRTFYINCTMKEVSCTKVRCFIDSIGSNQLLSVHLRMVFNISSIKDSLGTKDVILYTTQGLVNTKNIKNLRQIGGRFNQVYVSSLFVGASSKEEIKYWIIIISVLVGLLLVLLLIMALVKFGFFKRATKEELQLLKKEIKEKESGEIDVQPMTFSATQVLE